MSPRLTRRSISFLTALALASVLTLGGAGVALARPGDVDTTFGGGDGSASSLDFPGQNREAKDVVVQPDGKILVAGSRGRTVSSNMAVWRLTADGQPDTTFSGDGVAVVDLGGREFGEELALTSTGRIVVVGSALDAAGASHLAMARLTPSGAFDPSFSGDGKLVRGGTVATRGYGVAIDGTDRIVVAGGRGFSYAVFRYTPAGGVDRSFGGSGVVTIGGLIGEWGSNLPIPVDLVLQPDGRILALGVTEGGSYDCVVARLTSEGGIDPSFDGDGIAPAGFPPESVCSAIVLSPVNGKVTIAGQQGASSMVLARFTSTGALDQNFDDDGRIITTLGVAGASAHGLGLEGTKTIAVGQAVVGGDPRWVVARFTGKGQLDATTFGDAGRIFTNHLPCCAIEAAISAHIVGGKLIVGGGSVSSGWRVTRYLAGDV